MTTKQIIGVVEFLVAGAFLGAYQLLKDKDWSVVFLTSGVCVTAHGMNMFLS